MDITEDDKRRCVFLARYKKIGTNQWIRVGRPDIDTSDNDWPESFRTPQVEPLSATEAEVRVIDYNAVNLHANSLLGDFHNAAKRCDEALLRKFVGDVIVENLSKW